MEMLRESDIWLKLSAVGTLAASIVALSVAVVPSIWRASRGPRLVLRIGSVEPWARVTGLLSRGDQQAWLRVEIANEGHAEARNVRVVLHAWYEHGDRLAEWTKHDIDPSEMHWARMPPAWQGGGAQGYQLRETPPVVHIPRRLSEFADVIEFTMNSGRHRLVLDDLRPRGFSVEPRQGTGEFVLTLTAVADNTPANTKHMHYAVSRDNLFSDVRFDKSPPKDFRFDGLLSMIASAKGKLRDVEERDGETSGGGDGGGTERESS